MKKSDFSKCLNFCKMAYLVDILEELAGLVVGAHQLVAAVIVNVVREAVALLAHLKYLK